MISYDVICHDQGRTQRLMRGGGLQQGLQLVPSCHALLGGVQFTKDIFFLWHRGGGYRYDPDNGRCHDAICDNHVSCDEVVRGIHMIMRRDPRP